MCYIQQVRMSLVLLSPHTHSLTHKHTHGRFGGGGARSRARAHGTASSFADCTREVSRLAVKMHMRARGRRPLKAERVCFRLRCLLYACFTCFARACLLQSGGGRHAPCTASKEAKRRRMLVCGCVCVALLLLACTRSAVLLGFSIKPPFRPLSTILASSSQKARGTRPPCDRP